MNSAAPNLATLLQRFFIEYLMEQRQVSPCTIAAYRDSFRLLLAFAEHRLGKRPATLSFDDMTAPLILAFLNHLEQDRNNCVRTRNARFAAIRAFMYYVGLREPTLLALTQPILAIPLKRFERPLVGFITREQIEAVLAAPNVSTWSGRRDQVMLRTLYNSGARVSELIAMRIADLSLTPVASIRIHGKGRKERHVPLWRSTAEQLRRWIDPVPRPPDHPLFPNRAGGQLTRNSVADRLKIAVQAATRRCPDLAKQRITPHVVRHYLASRTM